MRRTVIFSLACAVLAIILIVWGFSAGTTAPPAAQVSGALLLVENDTGTYLMQLRKGLQEAIAERGGTLSLERLSDAEGADRRTSTEGFNAVYLLSDHPEQHLPALRQKGLPVIVLGKELRGETCVLPDELKGGQALGEYIASLPGQGELLVVGNRGDPLESLRLKGLESAAGDLSYALVLPEELDGEALARAAFVLALSDAALDAVLPLRGREGPPLFCFDAASDRLALMEEGRLDGVSADDPYALGYIAGSLIDDMIKDSDKPFLRLSPRRLVTRDTMYEAANVKLMFPLLH